MNRREARALALGLLLLVVGVTLTAVSGPGFNGLDLLGTLIVCAGILLTSKLCDPR